MSRMVFQGRRLSFGAVTRCSVVAALALAPTHALAQGAGSATLRGTVTDDQGGALRGAAVTVVNQRTKATRTADTDSRGEYVFAALVSGPYRAQIDLTGFARWDSEEFHLSPGDSRHLATMLVVAGRAEAVTVEAQRDIIRTDTGAHEETISADQIQNLSIMSRSAMELLRILPGVATDTNNDGTVGFYGGSNQFFFTSVNGTRGTTISPALDGSKIVDFGSNSSLMLNMNPDMVDEVKIQTGNYAAEYGASSIQITR
jgi:hypothetical protein